jgi:SAM-dependent methyltransferase
LITQIGNGNREWLEVGCGLSLLADILKQRGSSLDHVLLTDSSPSMLRYSARWHELGAVSVLSSADALPVQDSSVDVVVSSLGDPYNTKEFWSEVRRCLKSGGRAFFTTPSYEWASSYRHREHYPDSESEFLLRSGVEVTLPSLIVPEAEQIDLIEASGLKVVSRARFALSELTGRVSPKLRIPGSVDVPIVVAYVATSWAQSK